MENKKIYQTETKTIIDHQTGEIIQTEHNQKGFVEKEPDYVKLYLQDIARLNNLPPSASSLMTLIIRSMGYNNLFFAFKPLKEMFCEELKMPMNTLNKQIDNFYVNRYTNALTTLLKSTQNENNLVNIFAIKLEKVLRGPITEWAENILANKFLSINNLLYT